jgi:hypothetical protein
MKKHLHHLVCCDCRELCSLITFSFQGELLSKNLTRKTKNEGLTVI